MATRLINSPGAWLKQARKALDLTQSELAERAGCSLKTIAKIESGERRPSKQLAELLAVALEIAPDDFSQFVLMVRGVVEGAESAVVHRSVTNGTPMTTATPPLRPAKSLPGNLPVPPTRFIGRGQLLAQLREMLNSPHNRLVTLTGIGGVGKTRTAIEAAEQFGWHFPDGVFFVNLAPLAVPELLIPTLARTLGVRETASEALFDALKSQLRDTRTLLILDNFEHIVQAAPVVADLLAACRDLKVLVTSRQVLHLRGEREVQVRPLVLPSTGGEQTVEHWADNEAVRLFVERAQDRQLEFALDESNIGLVVAICRRLEGLPLALELAATRVGTLPLETMLEHLEIRLNMLTGPLVDLPDRQRTLRSTIGWSYRLLESQEQELFRRVALFSGSFTPDAARAVALSAEETLQDVLARLGYLADKSLLFSVADTHHEPRFGMLEIIRDYAGEKLEESGQADAYRRKHTEYYLALAQQAEPLLRGAEQKYWLDRLELEHDNFRAAIRWSLESGDAQLSLLLCGWLTMFWYYKSYFTEGRRWMEEALRTVDRVPIELAAKGYNQAGVLAQGQGDLIAALDLYKKSLAVWRKVDDERRVARTVYNVAGVLMANAQFDEAGPYLNEVLPFFVKTGEQHMASSCLNYLSLLAEHEGDLDRATTLCKQSLSIDDEIGDARHIGTMKARLGEIALKRGNATEAGCLLREALNISHGVGDKSRVAKTFESLGAVAQAQGDAARAGRLFAAGGALRRTMDAPPTPFDRAASEPYIAAARAALGEASWRAAWAAGSTMDLEQAVLYALGEA